MKFRKIEVTLWNDAKFRSFSDSSKLLWMMFLTHPHTSSIGTLRLTKEGISAELGWSLAKLGLALKPLTDKGMIVYADGLFWIQNFLKYNPPANPNIVSGFLAAIEDCPECELLSMIKQKIIEFLNVFPEDYRKAFEAVLHKKEVNALNGSANYSPSIENREKRIEKKKNVEEKSSDEILQTKKTKEKESKKTFGEYNTVRLTEAEYDRLNQICRDYSVKNNVEVQPEQAIRMLDLYLSEKKQDPYKSHLAAIQRWVLNAVRDQVLSEIRATRLAASNNRAQFNQGTGTSRVIENVMNLNEFIHGNTAVALPL